MRNLKDIAQAARFEAMKPAALRLAVPSNDQADDGKAAFHRAAYWAATAREARARRRLLTTRGDTLAGWWEGRARDAERKVREIALQSEIWLQRQADQLPAGPCHQPMLDILLGAAA